MKPSTILTKIRTLFRDPSHHTKGVYARDKAGNSVAATDPRAVCWCVMGGIRHICPSFDDRQSRVKAIDLLTKAAGMDSVARYNDDPRTTHEKLLAWIDKAIALAKGGESPDRVKKRSPGAKAGRRAR